MRALLVFVALLGLLGLSTSAIPKSLHLSKDYYHALNQVDKLMAQNKFDLAIKKLNKLKAKTNTGNLSKQAKFNRAMVLQYLSHSYFAKGDKAKARQWAIAALKLKLLAADVEQNLRLMAGQLAFEAQDYFDSIKLLKPLLASLNTAIDRVRKAPRKPKTKQVLLNQYTDSKQQVVYLLAYNHFHLKQYNQAEAYLKHELAKADNSYAADDWQQLLLQIYLDTKAWSKAERLLKKRIAQNYAPNQPIGSLGFNWWQYLIQVQLTQENYQEALLSLELLAMQYHLNPSQTEQLVQLYSYNQLPLEAAELLDFSMNIGKVKKTLNNRKLLFQLWFAAREYKKATEVLELAARISKAAQDYQLLGQIYFQQGQWQASQNAFSRFIEFAAQENKSKPEIAQAYLMLAISSLELKLFKKAKSHIQKAQEFKLGESQYSYWDKQIEIRMQLAHTE